MNMYANEMNNSCLEVDLGALRENARRAGQSLSGSAAVIPVLKGDAYGLGLVPCARALAALPGIGMFAVAHVSEALRLREAGIAQELLVLGNPLPAALEAGAAADVTFTVGRPGLLPELAECAGRLGRAVKAELKLDTGLHRVGAAPGDEFALLLDELRRAGERVELRGIYSHFADTADEARCAAQYALYLQGLDQAERAGFAAPRRHICDSAASELYPQYHLDAVRLGRRLIMDNPIAPLGGVTEPASWRTFITDVRRRAAGDSLGYGGAFTLPSDALVATLGVGYGDGLPPALAEAHGEVLVGGRRARLLTCCMDQCLADVTGLACAVGDEVTIFGRDAAGNFLSAQETAAVYGGNEGCAITTALSPRVARRYLNG